METINDVIKEQETAEQETANQVTENRKGRKKKTKCVNNFGRIGWILVLGLVLEVIVSSIVLYIVQRKNPALLEDANLSTIVSYIMLIVSIYLPTIFLGRKLEKREIQKNKMPFGMLMVSIIVIYSAGILSNIVGTIINYVLGIKPKKPGYEEIIIEPHLGDLAWARGAISTKFGRVEVQAEKDENSKYYSEIEDEEI